MTKKSLCVYSSAIRLIQICFFHFRSLMPLCFEMSQNDHSLIYSCIEKVKFRRRTIRRNPTTALHHPIPSLPSPPPHPKMRRGCTYLWRGSLSSHSRRRQALLLFFLRTCVLAADTALGDCRPLTLACQQLSDMGY